MFLVELKSYIFMSLYLAGAQNDAPYTKGALQQKSFRTTGLHISSRACYYYATKDVSLGGSSSCCQLFIVWHIRMKEWGQLCIYLCLLWCTSPAKTTALGSYSRRQLRCFLREREGLGGCKLWTAGNVTFSSLVFTQGFLTCDKHLTPAFGFHFSLWHPSL